METEKAPILGLLQRGGKGVRQMLEKVQQVPIAPVIGTTVAAGAQIYTDEYDRYARLECWGYLHDTVGQGQGEYGRDEEGDGVHEVPVNTLEGVGSLLRSWLRPHRGISPAKLPWDLGVFEFVHHAKARGTGLLKSLLAVLLQ